MFIFNPFLANSCVLKMLSAFTSAVYHQVHCIPHSINDGANTMIWVHIDCNIGYISTY